MESTAPQTRLVICPKCRNVLPEAMDVPMYQCGVCDTILLAKSYGQRRLSIASMDSVFNFTHMNEFDHGSDTDSCISNAESFLLNEEASKRMADGLGSKYDGEEATLTKDESSDATIAGKTSNPDDGSHEMVENLKNGHEPIVVAEQTTPNQNVGENEHEIGGDAIKCLDDHLGKNIDPGNDANMCMVGQMEENLNTGELDANKSLQNGKESEDEDGDKAIDHLAGDTTQNQNLDKNDPEITCLDGQLERNLNLGIHESKIGDEAIECLGGASEKSTSLEKKESGSSKSKKSGSEENNPIDGDLSFNGARRRNFTIPTKRASSAHNRSRALSAFEWDSEGKVTQTPLRLSRRTFRPKTQSVPCSPLQCLKRDVLQEQQEPDFASQKSKGLPSFCSDEIGSFKSDNNGSSSSSQDRQSEDLYQSLMNAADLEEGDEDFSSSQMGRNDDPSSNSRGTQTNRMELLRKVDDLRIYLMGSLEQQQNTSPMGKISSQTRGNKQSWRPPRPSSITSMQELENDLLKRSQKHPPPLYCTNCHLLPQQGIFCNKGFCMSCCHSYCHPSNTINYHSHMKSNHLSSPKNLRMSKPKAKDQIARRHCRPISGGSSFIICPECLELLQMPDDFHISRHGSNKLRCGSCENVLTFSFPERRYSAHMFRGNKVPLFNDSGEFDEASFSGSSRSCYTMEKEQMLYVPGNNNNSMDGLQYPLKLHRLMGYCSASDMMYQLSEGEEKEWGEG